MPSNSKRNRRAQAQRANLQRAAENNRNELINPVIPHAEARVAAPRTQNEKTTSSYGPSGRGNANAAFINTNFTKDIKWIGVVTGIIIILLVISYYVFK
jgi:hypothetical protein